MSRVLHRGVYEKKSRYVEPNNKLFPSFILANFGMFKLPKLTKTDKDPCQSDTESDPGTSEKTPKKLKLYQEFVGKLLDAKSPYRNLLLYHSLGSGKTATAINAYNTLYNNNPDWNVFILTKASLRESWLGELKTWLEQPDQQARFKNITLINYDAPNAEKSFMTAVKSADLSKKTLFIIDECHNFIRNVYGNMTGNTGGRAKKIYDHIINVKKDSPDTRVILISGTPAVNEPFELALLFNLLRLDIFPNNPNEFNRLFTINGAINKDAVNQFQRRIIGLVSFYDASPPGVFAVKTFHSLNVPMSNYQADVYHHFAEIEARQAAKAKQHQKASQSYMTLTRSAANAVFPPISQSITGEGRPRPGKFRISERDAQKLAEADESKVDFKSDGSKVLNVTAYKNALSSYIRGFKDFLKSKNTEDINNKHTILDDVKAYDGDFEKFRNDKTKKSKLFDAMILSSAKFTNIVFNVMRSPGPAIIYSSFVLNEGLEWIRIYLEFLGFYNYMQSKKLIDGRVGFVEFHGGIDMLDRKNGMAVYNSYENRYGALIKVILVSSAGTEGLSLRNSRQLHLAEPYWNMTRMKQMEGRGIRTCSHSDLPLDERTIDIYKYYSVYPKDYQPPKEVTTGNMKDSHVQKDIRVTVPDKTADQIIEEIAQKKEGLIQGFLDAMKEIAVDCVLFKDQNMIKNEYKCFQFQQDSLFDKNVGPAYREDIRDDINFDEGTNATNSQIVKIKVNKIQAVVLLSKVGETPRFSKSKEYWMYPQSGVVYDFELHFAIGRVARTEEGYPIKIDKNTYLISELAIPLLTSE